MLHMRGISLFSSMATVEKYSLNASAIELEPVNLLPLYFIIDIVLCFLLEFIKYFKFFQVILISSFMLQIYG